MRARVDGQLCQGHGRCYATAPELFEPDDLGNGHEIDDGIVAPGLEHQAEVAVANCPEQAIRLEETS